MTHLLAPGDLVKCLHCSDWHPAEPSNHDAGTIYERSMLYTHCGTAIYFVGTIGGVARQPAKRPE